MKRLVGTLIVVVSILVILGIVASRPVPKVQATSCSNATLSGGYAGYTFGTSGGKPLNDVIIYNFNGQGNMTWEEWSSLGGKFGVGDGPGTYSVNSGCTGTFTIGAYTWYVVVKSGGKEVDILEDAPDNNFSQVIKQQ